MENDFTDIYGRIADSEWFRRAYSGKSVGDVIPVEDLTPTKDDS